MSGLLARLLSCVAFAMCIVAAAKGLPFWDSAILASSVGYLMLTAWSRK